MWDDLKPSQIEVPITLIRNIANELNAITKQALIFSAETDVYHDFPDLAEMLTKEDDDAKRIIRLKLHAPSLNAFTIYLLSIVNDIRTIYPCNVTDLINKNNSQANSYEELEKQVRTLLNDNKIKTVIANLWAQAIR